MSMTDEQIVKALECCIKSDHFGECFANKCPMISEEGCKVWNDDHKLLNMLYDLIKRQQAEIESLEADKEAIINGQLTLQKMYLESRAEAIQEFAERLKEKSWIGMWDTVAHVDIDDVDDLVEEMTEEKENG